MIEVKNVFFSYTGMAPYVLNGVDLTIQDGEYVSVVGENGSGKTTLIRLVLRFLKPTSGVVSVQAARIGYVPQRRDFADSEFPITVYEALDSYRRLLRQKDRDTVKNGLKQVGLAGYANTLMGNLSGGQHQKVLIARALIGSPDLLILDEPSTGVDINSQKDIYGILKRINSEDDITIVSVEHNLDAAVANSTSIYHLVGGKGHLCSPRQYADEFLKK